MIGNTVFAVLCSIERFPERFLVVSSIDRIGYRKRRRCLEGLSGLCRRLESGQVHGAELFAHARNTLGVLFIGAVAFL